MCGINAVYRYTEISKNDLQRVKSMNDGMRYRGPDGEGYWNDEHCALGHVRLSIIGLETGAQPLFNKNKTLVLISNGEIYNYRELKKELAAKGYECTTDSDCEVVLYLYELYGLEFVHYLRGIFALCLYDTRNQQLIVVRDRIGEERVYYAEMPCGVVVSSELKAILQAYITQPQLNMESLLAPIRFTGGVDKRNTWVEQVKRVLPGEMLIIDADGVRHKHYWERKRTYDFEGTLEQAKKKTLELLHEAVDIEMRSDVPVAIMLSGGVDSSAVAAVAKHCGHEVHTITTGYTGSHAQDERDVAKRFAGEQGFIYHEIELSERDYLDSFDELTSYLDEPMTDSTAIAQWAMFKKVKELGFKVLLGGMGGDELFYGYPAWNALGESLKLRREHEAIFPWNTKEKKIHWLRFMRRHLKWILTAGYPFKIDDHSFSWWNFDDYYRFLKDATLNINGENVKLEDYRYKIQKGYSLCELGKEIDVIYDEAIETVMTQAYLYLSDRLSMGCSLEGRSPLLDYKLYEHVMSLPLQYKYVPGKPKQYFKDVLAGIVPDYILYARKRGFASPPSFITHVTHHYQYQCFNSNYKFYGSVLADILMAKLLLKKQ